MKATYTRSLIRKIIIAFLAFVIVFIAVALFMHNRINNKFKDIVFATDSMIYDHSRPEKALLLLHQAEENFQMSLLNGNKQKSFNHKEKLNEAFHEIDTLIRKSSDASTLTQDQKERFKIWYERKMSFSTNLQKLKYDFDSLLNAYADYTIQAERKSILPAIRKFEKSVIINTSTDTIKKIVKKESKGLFKRLKDAISNKNDTTGVQGLVEVNNNNNNQISIVDKTVEEITSQNKKDNEIRFRQLQSRNKKLMDTQRGLIILNTRITNELEIIINKIKEINYSMAEEFKAITFKKYQESVSINNNFYLIMVLLILLLVIILIIFIVQINRSELLLRRENHRSLTMAEQKMDLLLHLSHEIRNPLTSIKWFLDIFRKTDLSEQQLEMVDSITHASELLLHTLNDTLDAAKMENSEFKLNKDPFIADSVLSSVVKSMEFSAIKKGIALHYSFKGNKNSIILGDSLRLKQIMNNLISNAIKFTSAGSVTVNAELLKDDNRLKVEVIDTGVGISPEQQANLFSKYYQTNSSVSQTGTGLGLFICRQLIQLQDGKIFVKSTPNIGSVFSFYIPYDKTSMSSLPVIENNDRVPLLNGVKVLAVDDNELNIMLLKQIMELWEVTFFQAANGKEALNIIAQNDIKLVITDVHMPLMNGYELSAAIKNLKPPLNLIPVIVAGDTTQAENERKYLEMGFSGVIQKPYSKKELLEQVLKVLKR